MKIHEGDCLEILPMLEAASVDAIVTDPPYGLGFMGKDWDHGVPGVPFWAEALRILKPGGHLVAFGGTRTYHRLTCALEDAGFEIRDCLMWLYGSGFPKSLDVSKAIDKAAGAERPDIGANPTYRADQTEAPSFTLQRNPRLTGPATDAARQWSGWGTALKPAWEPIILARKPLVGTVAATVQEHGTGALNVDGCRLTASGEAQRQGAYRGGTPAALAPEREGGKVYGPDLGRWPANLALDEAAAAQLAAQSGGASRFFYTAKASAGERHYAGKNTHPTVKPVELMRWLCRLVTPPGGLVLDPFMGSGSTGIGALAEGLEFEGIEQDSEMVGIARRRVFGPLFAGKE